jgi:GNAT superfamily N-acetyltransferase
MRLALEAEGGSAAADDPGFRRAVGRWFSEHVGTESFRAWIAEEDGRVVAFGGLVLVTRPPYTNNPSGLEGLVTSMYTVPDRRGRGIGAGIMDAMVEAARGLGVGRLVLYSSKGAESLYRRFGFTDDVERGARLHRWLGRSDGSDP